MLSLSVQEVLQPQQCTAYGNKKKRKEKNRKEKKTNKQHEVPSRFQNLVSKGILSTGSVHYKRVLLSF